MLKFWLNEGVLNVTHSYGYALCRDANLYDFHALCRDDMPYDFLVGTLRFVVNSRPSNHPKISRPS